MYLTDCDGRFLDANPALLELLGYTRADIARTTFAEIIPPEQLPLAQRLTAALQDVDHKAPAAEYQVRRADGSLVLLETQASVLLRDGVPYAIQGITRDITERRRDEEALQLQYRLQELLTNISSTYINLPLDALEPALDRSLDEAASFVGADRAVIHDYDFERELARPIHEWAASGTPITIATVPVLPFSTYPEWDLDLHRRGESVWMPDTEALPAGNLRSLVVGLGARSILSTPIMAGDQCLGFVNFAWNRHHHLSSGREQQLLTAFAGLLVNLRSRQHAESRIRESEQKFRTLFETAGDAIFLMERTCFVDCNATALTMFRCTRDQLIGHPVAEFSPTYQPDDRSSSEVTPGRIEAAFEDRPQYFSWQHIRADGTTFPAQVSFSRVELGGQMRLQAIVRDVTERMRSEALIQESAAKLRGMMYGTIHAITAALERRDPYTVGHERRVGQLAYAIAEELGLAPGQAEGTRIAGNLQDLGKIGVPTEILSKPGRLLPVEFELLKTHSQCGYEILTGIEFDWPVAEATLQHHERLDGSGYPEGLRGDDIILEARIIAVAEAVEAMVSHRPYRPARGLDVALQTVTKGAGQEYDQTVVEACLTLFQEKGFSFD